jgi:hypothetical protein
MRASPAFQIEILRFDAWRHAVVAAALLAASAGGAWWLSDDGSRSRWLALTLAGASLAGLAGAASLMRPRSMRLRWDSQQWHLTAASPGVADPSPGRLSVALDLDAWMLLKFEHDRMISGRRVSWLPVQRRGLEAHWHALRCAVYCARSAPGHDAGPNPAMRPESRE